MVEPCLAKVTEYRGARPGHAPQFPDHNVTVFACTCGVWEACRVKTSPRCFSPAQSDLDSMVLHGFAVDPQLKMFTPWIANRRQPNSRSFALLRLCARDITGHMRDLAQTSMRLGLTFFLRVRQCLLTLLCCILCPSKKSPTRKARHQMLFQQGMAERRKNIYRMLKLPMISRFVRSRGSWKVRPLHAGRIKLPGAEFESHRLTIGCCVPQLLACCILLKPRFHLVEAAPPQSRGFDSDSMV